MNDHPSQLTLAHARARAAPPRPAPLAPRRREHAAALTRLAGTASSTHVFRDAQLDAVKRELAEFLRGLGVGATFQAADFTRRLDAVGGRPHMDLRGQGGLFVALARAGLITRTGYQPTGVYGGAKSSARPVYRVDTLDFDRLDWPCLRRTA